ncbi:hypothetical protein BS50DRAFT_274121 [Corynespora cassiicola Philippines]|uniref:Uncharacterized protein n=1 Tax=Corynespora cassiicola Philippines TaxID=1448308 RepID=A0A2T2P0A4_CORCC|nr:hypothetical protein BS50DRAFT_274121 [Corynespora cassiicola Philippines]
MHQEGGSPIRHCATVSPCPLPLSPTRQRTAGSATRLDPCRSWPRQRSLATSTHAMIRSGTPLPPIRISQARPGSSKPGILDGFQFLFAPPLPFRRRLRHQP